MGSEFRILLSWFLRSWFPDINLGYILDRLIGPTLAVRALDFGERSLAEFLWIINLLCRLEPVRVCNLWMVSLAKVHHLWIQRQEHIRAHKVIRLEDEIVRLDTETMIVMWLLLILGNFFNLVFSDNQVDLNVIVLRWALRVSWSIEGFILNFVQFWGEFVSPIFEILELLLQPFNVRIWAKHPNIMVTLYT